MRRTDLLARIHCLVMDGGMEILSLAQDSIDFGRGARPLQGGVGGKLIPPHRPPRGAPRSEAEGLEGGTTGGWKKPA
jgi:hypothetical protein